MKTKTRISKKNILTTTIKTTVAALVSAVMLEAGSAQAAILIDDFTVEQLVESDDNNENTKGPHGDNIIGGYRDMFIQQNESERSKLEVKNGEARYSNDAGPNATAEIFWNGLNGDRENTTGLGGIDITDGGTLNSIALDFKADLKGLDIKFYIYDRDGNNASISQLFMEGDKKHFLSFNRFDNANNLDFTDVGAMKLVLNGPERLDADIRLIEITNNESQSIPEPTSILGLLVIGATGAGSILKRKHNR